MHFKFKKQNLLFILVALLSITAVLTACGQEKETLTATAPENIITPAPSHSPRVDIKETVTFNGSSIPCYTDPSAEDVKYVLLTDVMNTIKSEAIYNNAKKCYEFTWREKDCSVSSESTTLIYGDKTYEMAAPTFTFMGNDNLYVPVESFCEGLEIGTLYDKANFCLYCTPASGNWTLPSGRTVPVIMHSSTGEDYKAIDDYIGLELLEQEFQYLLSNGYTFCWIEDLWNLDNIEKPIIMSFDDGWASNYNNLLPLIKKYNTKVTLFVVPGNIDSVDKTSHGSGISRYNAYMTTEELMEMINTGLVSIQSHSMNDPADFLSEEDYTIESEIKDTKLFLTRLTGLEPIAFAYPNGQKNAFVEGIVKENFRFAFLSDSNSVWTTGTTDNMSIPRFRLDKNESIDYFSEYLETGSVEFR